jgi:septal ring factor EnvC (AmiA/AmiB activator)
VQRLEEELELKTNEVVAMSEDLVNVTAENQSVNAELIDVVSSRDQAREQMGAMELRLGHAESAVMMKETEYRELLASYRCVILL